MSVESYSVVLDRAIGIVGGGAAGLGRIYDPAISGAAVAKWRKKGVPANRVSEIEKATGFSVTRYNLRPDIFGALPPVFEHEKAA